MMSAIITLGDNVHYRLSPASIDRMSIHFDRLLTDSRVRKIYVVTEDNLEITINKPWGPENDFKYWVKIKNVEDGTSVSSIGLGTDTMSASEFGIDFSKPVRSKNDRVVHGYVCAYIQRIIGVGDDYRCEYVYYWD